MSEKSRTIAALAVIAVVVLLPVQYGLRVLLTDSFRCVDLESGASYGSDSGCGEPELEDCFLRDVRFYWTIEEVCRGER